MTEMSKKIFFMFFIFGGYVKSPKGKKKIKATRDFLQSLWPLLIHEGKCINNLFYQMMPRTRSSKAERAALTLLFWTPPVVCTLTKS